MKKSILLACLLAPILAFGQGARYDTTLNSSVYISGIKTLTAMSGATVQVCSAPANATPCTNYATIYTDSTLTVAATNPTTADVNGNFGTWFQSGQYQYTFTYKGQNFGPYSITIPIISSGRYTFGVQGAQLSVPSTVKWFGDSIGAGSSASSPAQYFTNIVAATKGWTLTNTSVGGYSLADMEDSIYATTVTSSSAYGIMPGVNDMLDAGLGSGTSPDRLTVFQNGLYATAWWLTVPTSAYKKTGQQYNNQTGTWTNSSKFGGTVVLQTAQVGATASYNVIGSSVCVASLVEALSDPTPAIINTAVPNASHYNITIDSIDYGDYATGVTNRLSRNERLYGAVCTPFSNLPEGVHTVVVTSGSGTDASNPAYVAFVAGNGGALTGTGPFLLMGDTMRLCSSTPTPCTVSGYSGSNGSDAAVAAINDKIKQVAQDVIDAGLGLAFADTTTAYDPNVAGYVNFNDGIHPTDIGHAAIAQKFVDVLGTMSQPSDHSGVSGKIKRYGISLGLQPSIGGAINLPQNSAIKWSDQNGPTSANFILLDPGKRLELATGYSGAPANSGTDTPANVRVAGNGNVVLDIGTLQSGSGYGWLQATNSTDNSTNYKLFFNPNGGNVGIGSTTANFPLDVTGVIRSSGKGQFEGGVQPAVTGDSITWFKKTTHAALDLASVATAACTAETTEAITGALFGDHCTVDAGTALEAGGFFVCKVTAADAAKWQLCNLSGGAIDRASDTYTIRDTR